MSLTILFQIPVDTGMANVSKEWDNPNLSDFYLLTGNGNAGWTAVASLFCPKGSFGELVEGLRSPQIFYSSFDLILLLPLLKESERGCKSLISFLTAMSTIVLYSSYIDNFQQNKYW